MIVLAVVVVSGAAAFQLVPMSAVIDPVASPPTVVFTISNTGADPIAVQLRVATRRTLPDGTEINDTASDQLQVFPSQLVVRPGATQTVRVRWIGEGQPQQELPFRLVAEQLPVNLSRTETEASGVQFMLRYRATVYVRPENTQAEIAVIDLTVDEDERTATITVENNGTRHQSFTEGRIVLIQDGTETVMPLREIEPFVTVNVLPGETRRVTVPLDLLPVSPDQVAFQFDR